MGYTLKKLSFVWGKRGAETKSQTLIYEYYFINAYLRLTSRKHGMLKPQLAIKSSTGVAIPLLFRSRIHERTISLRFLGIT
jgi:hypothetical protein